jgi:hypothetical protein
VTRRIAVKEIDLTGLGVVDVSGEQDPDDRQRLRWRKLT